MLCLGGESGDLGCHFVKGVDDRRKEFSLGFVSVDGQTLKKPLEVCGFLGDFHD